jgi:slime mold repeat-containing protein
VRDGEGDPAQILSDSLCNANNDPFQCCSAMGMGSCVGTTVYSCDDSSAVRCNHPSPVPTFNSTCTAVVDPNSDPFESDPNHSMGNNCKASPACVSEDTVAVCTVELSDFGNTNAFLINVCSFPSGNPNSKSDDCVVTPNNGFLTIVKTADPNDGTTFEFDLGAGQQSQDGSTTWSINGSGSVLISFAPGKYDLSEVVPPNWTLDSASCVINSNPPTGTGTSSLDGVSGFEIQTGLETICTFTDSNPGALFCNGDPNCDDMNPCTVDSCDPNGNGSCVHHAVMDGTPCNADNSKCTPNDSCQMGTCVADTAHTVTCTASDQCHVAGTCDPMTGMCSNPAAMDGTACNADNSKCTPNDSCQMGTCIADTAHTVTCTASDQCHVAGTCDPTTGTCSNPAAMDGTACNDGNACTGSDACSGGVCKAGSPVNCNDGNPCTTDSCNTTTGCVHTDIAGASNGSCSNVTDTMYCPLGNTGGCDMSSTPNAFKLIELQDPTANSLGAVVMNDYRLNASNPGQFYYNVFYAGTPSSNFSLTIHIPWPFITQGANPIQVHDGVTLSKGCFVPNPSLPGYTITTVGGNKSSSGYPIILRVGPDALHQDYASQQLGSSTTVSVSGKVPPSGLLYVTIHLDYGLKPTTGWQQGGMSPNFILQGPDTDLNGSLTPSDGFGNGPVYIVNGQSYGFDFSSGGPTLGSTAKSCNAFKKNPGVNGLTLKASTQSPVSNVKVQLISSTGSVVASAVTDTDGFYQLNYKNTGKVQNFTVKLPDVRLSQTVALKANGYALVVFGNLP